jgi:hypothetical protein
VSLRYRHCSCDAISCCSLTLARKSHENLTINVQLHTRQVNRRYRHPSPAYGIAWSPLPPPEEDDDEFLSFDGDDDAAAASRRWGDTALATTAQVG